jgi:hypothetical protein
MTPPSHNCVQINLYGLCIGASEDKTMTPPSHNCVQINFYGLCIGASEDKKLAHQHIKKSTH